MPHLTSRSHHHQVPLSEPPCPVPLGKRHPFNPPNCPINVRRTNRRPTIQKCLNRMANGKALGPDGIPAELLKALPSIFHSTLTLLF